jgi:poly(hydroxyalkanoate) depolymerase family esterase
VPATEGTWDRRTYAGVLRRHSYSVYTPPGLVAGAAVPVVVLLHGCQQSAADAAAGTQLNTVADRAGFIAVYPEKTVGGTQGCWSWFASRHQMRGSGDPATIAGITEEVLNERDGPVLDRERVYVLGLSAGGAMAGILGATYPDLYAAVGIHSSPQYRAARSLPSAVVAMTTGGPNPVAQGRLAHAAMGPRARVVPVMVVQGDRDRTVWPGNGERVVRQWLTTTGLASGGSLHPDFARPDASHVERSAGGLSYSVRRWHASSGLAVVEFWLVAGLGHAWSGGAAASSYTEARGPSATEGMYRFLSQHRLSDQVTPPVRPIAPIRPVRRLGEVAARGAGLLRRTRELWRRRR